MQGLRGNSALFWALEKARVRQPILMLFPRLVLGTPGNAGVAWQFRPLLGPQEGRGEVTTFRPQKQRKVRSRADTSMPTTTHTMRSIRRHKPPPPTDSGSLYEGDSTLERR